MENEEQKMINVYGLTFNDEEELITPSLAFLRRAIGERLSQMESHDLITIKVYKRDMSMDEFNKLDEEETK